MPLYDFLCMRCGLGFEALVASSDQRTAPCPYCRTHGKEAVGERQASAPGLVVVNGFNAKNGYSNGS
jgi:putative FmdB family regulatory protein